MKQFAKTIKITTSEKYYKNDYFWKVKLELILQ